MLETTRLPEGAFQTAPDIAYNIILRRILDGEYPPGAKVSGRKMAGSSRAERTALCRPHGMM